MIDQSQDKTVSKSPTLTDVLVSFLTREILTPDNALALMLVFAALILPRRKADQGGE